MVGKPSLDSGIPTAGLACSDSELEGIIGSLYVGSKHFSEVWGVSDFSGPLLSVCQLSVPQASEEGFVAAIAKAPFLPV